MPEALVMYRGIDLKFQFTPLREGRLLGVTVDYLAGCISIHAPPRGATLPVATVRRLPKNFNSRPSARGDIKYLYNALVRELISIHAPPRGATDADGKQEAQATYFNSRHSARGDKKISVSTLTARYFNSRPSARGDR